mgnify:CR=1 FL=1
MAKRKRMELQLSLKAPSVRNTLLVIMCTAVVAVAHTIVRRQLLVPLDPSSGTCSMLVVELGQMFVSCSPDRGATLDITVRRQWPSACWVAVADGTGLLMRRRETARHNLDGAHAWCHTLESKRPALPWASCCATTSTSTTHTRSRVQVLGS